MSWAVGAVTGVTRVVFVLRSGAGGLCTTYDARKAVLSRASGRPQPVGDAVAEVGAEVVGADDVGAALLEVGVRVGAAEAGPPGVAEVAVLAGAEVVGVADSVAVGLGVGLGDFEAVTEDPNPSDVRDPFPSVPPVRFEIDSPVSSSKLRMTIMAITKIAPETIAIHFQGSRASASRHGGRPWSSGLSSSSTERVCTPVRARDIRATAAACAAWTRSRLIRSE